MRAEWKGQQVTVDLWQAHLLIALAGCISPDMFHPDDRPPPEDIDEIRELVGAVNDAKDLLMLRKDRL